MNMDRLKFRVWDEKYKTYFHQVTIGTDCAHGVWVTPDKVDYICKPHWDSFENEHIPEYNCVEQCVGICDKHHKLIYEGDILRDKDGHKSMVVWLDGDCRFINVDYDEYINGIRDEPAYISSSVFAECEIVGNIHTTRLPNNQSEASFKPPFHSNIVDKKYRIAVYEPSMSEDVVYMYMKNVDEAVKCIYSHFWRFDSTMSKNTTFNDFNIARENYKCLKDYYIRVINAHIERYKQSKIEIILSLEESPMNEDIYKTVIKEKITSNDNDVFTVDINYFDDDTPIVDPIDNSMGTGIEYLDNKIT